MYVFPFIYFLILFIREYFRCKSFDVGCAILAVYLFSSFCTILHVNSTHLEFTFIDNIIPTLLYCSLLTICVKPFFSFASYAIKDIAYVKEKTFKVVSWFFIVVSFIALILSFNDIKDSLFSDLGRLRSAFYDDSYDSVIGGQVWYKYILSLVVPFSPIMLLFFFYSVAKMKNGILFNILLFAASLIMVVQSFTNASRTQVIYWILTFYILYVLFRPVLSKKIKYVFSLVAGIMVLILAVYFIAVTISRFGEGDDAESSLLYYAGSSYLSFCDVYNHYSFQGLTFDRLLPITTKYIFGNNFNITLYREMIGAKIGTPVNLFFTFLGDAMIDFGIIGMILYAILQSFLTKKILYRRQKSVITLSQMILFVLIARQMLLGLFAYVYLSISSSILIIGSLFLSYYFRRKNLLYRA